MVCDSFICLNSDALSIPPCFHCKVFHLMFYVNLCLLNKQTGNISSIADFISPPFLSGHRLLSVKTVYKGGRHWHSLLSHCMCIHPFFIVCIIKICKVHCSQYLIHIRMYIQLTGCTECTPPPSGSLKDKQILIGLEVRHPHLFNAFSSSKEILLVAIECLITQNINQ